MTVKAELQFVTDAASEANKAADAVARFRSELQTLQGLSGKGSSVGPNLGGASNAVSAQAANVAALQIKGANEVAVIQANASAAQAASQHRIAEQYQKDRNAILVSGAAASHALMAQETSHAHKLAEIEKKGVLDHSKLRIKGEEDRARIAAKDEADRAKIAAKYAADQAKEERREKKKAATLAARNVSEETTSGAGGAAKAILEGKGIGGALGAYGGKAAQFAAVAELAVDAVKKVGSLTVEFGKAVVGSQAYKEDIQEAFITVRKTNLAADATFQTAIENADKLGFARAESIGQFLDLATKGFDDAKIKEIQGRLLDITTIDPRANVDQLMKIIGQVKATGRVNQETLSMLATAGLEQADVIGEIGKALGKNDKEVLRLLSSAGGIRDDQNVDFILRAIANQTGDAEAGAKFAEKSDRNLSSLIRRIEEIPSNILFDVQVGPGIDSIKAVMKQVIAYFDVGSETGQRVRKVVGDLFNALSEGLFGKRIGDEKGITGTLDSIVSIAEKAVPVVRELATDIGSLSRAILAIGSGDTKGLDESTKRMVGLINLGTELVSLLRPVGGSFGFGGLIQPILDIIGIDYDASGIRKWVDGVAGLLNPMNILRTIKAGVTGGDTTLGNPILQALQDAITGAGESAIASARNLGSDIVSGLVGGIQSGLSRIGTMATNMGATVIASVRGALDSHSPARELIKVGLDATTGLAIGGERGTPMVAGAFSSMAMAGLMAAAAVPPLPMAMPIGMSGASSSAMMLPSQANALPAFTFAPVIQVSVGNGTDNDAIASAIEERIKRMIPDAITAYLEAIGGTR